MAANNFRDDLPTDPDELKRYYCKSNKMIHEWDMCGPIVMAFAGVILNWKILLLGVSIMAGVGAGFKMGWLG